MKVHLFLLKKALGPRYKPFYIYFAISLQRYFRHTFPAPISISFFCFFTDNQPQIYLSVRELFSKKIVFQYTLLYTPDHGGFQRLETELFVWINICFMVPHYLKLTNSIGWLNEIYIISSGFTSLCLEGERKLKKSIFQNSNSDNPSFCPA